MISKDTIEKIKEVADILDVVGDFVQLKKSGQNYKALSPFSQEKTPSFYVVPSKGIFKDFSSGKGGDAITFLMELEGLSYLEALKFLAQKYGIEVEEKEVTPEELQSRTERESLFIILNFAKDRYKELLWDSDEGKAIGLSYFKERGFTEETIKNFDLGFSEPGWESFTKHALEKQYSEDMLVKAGLSIKKDDGKLIDRFRNRVIFPIHNLTGKVIAFGARILSNADKDKKQPKYLNSPETEVYHKSKIVYGIFQAKNDIRNEDRCYLVEGYTDVISMHQAGIKNVVSSSGTALTVEQIKLIKRYSSNITVIYDGDPAGIRASLRGIDMILEEGMNVNVVTLPEGEDPDSCAKKWGGQGFKEHIAKESADFITFKTKLFLEETKNDPIKKAEVIRQIVESIAKIPDSIKRSVFFQECSHLLGIEESTLIAEHNKIVLNKQQKPEPRTPNKSDEELLPVPKQEEEKVTVNTVELQEKEIVKMLLNYGDHMIEEDMPLSTFLLGEVEDVVFENEVYKRIVEEFRAAHEKEVVIKIDDFLNMEDSFMKGQVIDLISEKYELSEQWNKFQIFVPKDEDILGNLIYKNILRLKWRKIRTMLVEMEQSLKEVTEEEEVLNIQKMYMELRKSEVEISKLLGIVVNR